MCKLSRMLTGDELRAAMTALPDYGEGIRQADKGIRLSRIEDLYSIYLPSDMSEEIYSRIYMAVVRSLKKKNSPEAVRQYKRNFGLIHGKYAGAGIIGGADSFSIIGKSGIGKSASIIRSLQLISEEMTQDTDIVIIPAILVQTPQDNSVKSLLLEILRDIDMHLGSNYWDKAYKANATVDMLIGSVSQVALNHVGMIIVDEIQNVVKHKGGQQLVSTLTQLINNAGVSICMVGTPECKAFFRTTDYLARRAVGLEYGPCDFGEYFKSFCSTLFAYQYTKEGTELTDGIVRWLYERSGGIISNVVKILAFSQEIAIIKGYEVLNELTLSLGVERLRGMMDIDIQVITGSKKKSRNMEVYLAELPVSEEEVDLIDIIQRSRRMERDCIEEIAKYVEVIAL